MSGDKADAESAGDEHHRSALRVGQLLQKLCLTCSFDPCQMEGLFRNRGGNNGADESSQGKVYGCTDGVCGPLARAHRDSPRLDGQTLHPSGLKDRHSFQWDVKPLSVIPEHIPWAYEKRMAAAGNRLVYNRAQRNLRAYSVAVPNRYRNDLFHSY